MALSTYTNRPPAVDIVETGDRFLLRADLPGIRAEDLDIRIADGFLHIAGERRTEPDDGGARRLAERASGGFQRRFRLPEGVDSEAISARCHHGVLDIEIPKHKQHKMHRIAVQAA